MQTLGLASEQKPTDGMLKRLFWPTIENQYDLDAVSVQGFWLCVIVAVLSFVLLTLTGNWFIGLLIFITYALGGTGVRERSVAAAVLVFSCYLFDKLLSIETLALTGVTGFNNPIAGVLALALLAANIRGTLLAKRWEHEAAARGLVADPDQMPERATTTAFDKVANTLPPRVWPVGRFIFFPLAGISILLIVLVMVMTPFAAKQRKQQIQQQQIEVTAPDR